ncbi:MAG: hypothetical protein RJA59_1763 [Pseudomonadota bacterium]
MPACALCENVQAAGESCDVCGHPFPAGERVAIPVEPIEGLEATVLPAVEDAGERMPDLEATSIDPVRVVAAAMEGLLPTVAEGIPGDDPLELPAVATCRYCRNPAPPGDAFCVHCGMRLPPQTGAAAAAPGEVALCRDCGVPLKGSSCPGCGARVPG